MDEQSFAIAGQTDEAPPEAPAFAIDRPETSPPDGPWTFARLLSPVPVEAFHRDYWGRHPLLLRGGGRPFYESLTSLGEIESLLAIPRILEDHMISVRGAGERVSLAPSSAGDMYRRLRDGASLQFRKMEQVLPAQAPLSVLYRDMLLTLQHHGVSISCFVAPPSTEQLGPHYDGTEIFTLQVSGRKRWRLYGQVSAEGRKSFPAGSVGTPDREFILGPGDLFYMPRGHIHEVTSEDGAVSLSFPIIIEPVTWKDMLTRLTERLAEHPAFLEALPAGLLLRPDAAAVLADGLAARVPLIAAEAARVDAAGLIDAAATRFLEGLGAPIGGHIGQTLAGQAGIDAETRLITRHGDAWRVSVRDGQAILTLGGGDALRAPDSIAPALRAIMGRREPVAAGALHASLSDKARLVLARKLVDIGALTLAVD